MPPVKEIYTIFFTTCSLNFPQSFSALFFLHLLAAFDDKPYKLKSLQAFQIRSDLESMDRGGRAFRNMWGRGGGMGLIVRPSEYILVFSKMSFALFVCTNKLLCDVYSVQCVRNRLMPMQEEAVV